MSLQTLLSLSLLGLTLSVARAQNADDFFHGGAQSYLSNNLPNALATVTNGLRQFPDDAKLKRLYELLNQQQQQNQQNQQPDKQPEQKPHQDKEGDQKDPAPPQKSKSDPEKEKQEKKNKQSGKSEDKAEAKPESNDSQPTAAHAMTPQEAQRLLDAQKGDEKVLQFAPTAEPKNSTKRLKDW